MNKCNQYVVGVNNKMRKCKNKPIKNEKYCKKHKKFVYPTVGQCCFCFEDCNEQSQSCGRCARKLF